MFADSLSGTLAGILFLLLLACVCVSDVRTRRIPNALVLAIALSGTAYSIGVAPWLGGGLRALGGLGVGLAIWLPFYVFRMLGAGDVKFFAAASAWLGPAGALEAALLSACFGGMLGLVFLFRSSRWALALARVSSRVSQQPAGAAAPSVAQPHRLPYGVAMAAGLVAVAWFPGLVG